MQHDFWQKKWDAQQIGFNQNTPNALLVEHFEQLNIAKGSRIFVPLSGKSIDMIWLAEQGYEVIGCELVESAVADFFNEQGFNEQGVDKQGIEVTVDKHATTANLTRYQGTHAGQAITIWAGDIFDLTGEDVGNIAGVYDRAALVALPDDGEDSLRKRYVKKVIELTATAPQLVLNFTINYDVLDESRSFDKETFGPPFVIDDKEIYDYYQADYDIKHLAKEVPNDTDVLVNQAWLLTPKD